MAHSVNMIMAIMSRHIGSLSWWSVGVCRRVPSLSPKSNLVSPVTTRDAFIDRKSFTKKNRKPQKGRIEQIKRIFGGWCATSRL